MEQRKWLVFDWRAWPKWGLFGLVVQIGVMFIAGAWLNYIVQLAAILLWVGIGVYAALKQQSGQRRYDSGTTVVIYMSTFIAIGSNVTALVLSVPIDPQTIRGQFQILLSGFAVLPTLVAAYPLLALGYWAGQRQQLES